MTLTCLAPSLENEVPPAMAAFYRSALRALVDAGIPFLVGGAFGMCCTTTGTPGVWSPFGMISL